MSVGWVSESVTHQMRRRSSTAHGYASLIRPVRLSAIILQPFQHVAGVTVGRKYRIEDMADARVVNDQRQPLDQRQPRDLHGRELERAGELELFVRQHREWQMQSRSHLGLIGVALGRQADEL